MVSCRWLIVSGCITLVMSGCGQAKPLSPGEIAKQVKASIVLISYQDTGGNGTGFFVQGDKNICTVLTTRHVVASSDKLQLQTPDQKLWKTVHIQRFPNYDLAVVTFNSNGNNCPYPALSLGNSDSVQLGERVYITGFPGGGGRLLQQFPSGDVTAIENPALPDGYGISYQVTTEKGMSGGPVVNTAGQVIAVHGRADTEVTRLTYRWGIPINIYLANCIQIYSELKTDSTASNVSKTLKESLRIGVLFDQGLTLGNLKRFEEAISLYEKAIQGNQDLRINSKCRGYTHEVDPTHSIF